MLRYTLTAACAVSAVTLAACGGEKATGPTGTTAPPPKPVASVQVTPSTRTLTALGATQQFQAVAKDADGTTVSGKTFTWASSATNVATIDASSGIATAVTNGSTSITATTDGVSGTASLTVAQTSNALVIRTQAAGASAGQPFTTQPVLEVHDANGNVAQNDNSTVVTAALASGGGTLLGTTTATATSGVVTFADLAISGTVGDRTLTFTAQGLMAVTSGSFALAPGPAAQMALDAGNNQTGLRGTTLAQHLEVRAADQFDNPVEGHPVNFVVASGGGSVSPPSALTDAGGQAETDWTLGTSLGAQTVEAQASGLTGSPIVFTATSIALVVTGTSVPLVEGQMAVVTGQGFDPSPASNIVTVDGTQATVAAATFTQLDIVVPTFDCQPARTVDVVITVSGETAPALSVGLNPASFVNLAVGQQLIIQSPNDLCLQFAAETGDEQYLIGIQSTSEAVTSLTDVTLTAVKDPMAPAPPIATLGATGTVSGFEPVTLSTRAERWQRHRQAETELRARERRFLTTPSAMRFPAAAVPAQIPPDVKVGDIVDIKVPNLNADFCTNSIGITTVVKVIGAKGIWLEDLANPMGGYSDADYQLLSDQFDGIYVTATDYFGDPTDIDGNARAVVVITKEVNKVELLGFLGLDDLFPTSICPSSNLGEFFYDIAPDPLGTFGRVYTTADGLLDAPPLVAHEFAHVIQFSRRIAANAPTFQTSWEFEGQATLAEEIVGHAVLGNTPGADYGFDVAFNTVGAPNDWYSDGFRDLAFYFGFESPTTRVAGAPEQCSWLGRREEGNDGPCLGSRQVYGTPWSLLRWLSDHFGPNFVDGEKGIHRALINNTMAGYDNIEDVIGQPIETLLAQWAAMLYVDGRVPGAAPKLTLPSWNLFNVFDENLVATARLTPRGRGFANFSDNLTVRGGSTGYFVVTGSPRPATAIRARTLTDADLPSIMQLFLVRLK